VACSAEAATVTIGLSALVAIVGGCCFRSSIVTKEWRDLSSSDVDVTKFVPEMYKKCTQRLWKKPSHIHNLGLCVMMYKICTFFVLNDCGCSNSKARAFLAAAAVVASTMPHRVPAEPLIYT
jgi:hypothetical protein